MYKNSDIEVLEKTTEDSVDRFPAGAISIVGAAEHNLKNISVDLPKKALVVFSGVSGSGKSSLAFDTIFAEGQRRYVESLSSYARQFLGQAEKPKYETIRGLSPTIAIEQKSSSSNPRSTVGTITEIYDYLRVLFTRIGQQHCYKCGKEVLGGDASSIVARIMQMPEGTKFSLLAPLIQNRKGEHRDVIGNVRQQGFARLRIDGVMVDAENLSALAKNKKHSIDAVVDRLIVKHTQAFTARLQDSVETALKLGQKRLIVHRADEADMPLNEAKTCCGIGYPDLDPPLFSFNSPLGLCPTCNGLGSVLGVDVHKIIPDKTLSIREGAVVPWRSFFNDGVERETSWGMRRIRAMQKKWKLNIDTPWAKLPKKIQQMILFGAEGESLEIKWKGQKGQGTWMAKEDGVVNRMLSRFKQSTSEAAKAKYMRYLSHQACEACDGKRLKPEVLAVKIGGSSIIDLSELSISDTITFFSKLKLKGNQQTIAKELVKEIKNRLHFLANVGLSYLSLSRKGPSLSGGEAQRIRLASQVGSELTGVIYVLDEPSIGLHQRDNRKLIATLEHLRELGNTVIVIEHDRETIEAADWLLDIGPGAGHLGGNVIYNGPVAGVLENKDSLTGRFLSGAEDIPVPTIRPVTKDHKAIVLTGANENNLKNVTCAFPLSRFIAVTGVSGAGKSTLINQILYPAVANRLHASTLDVGVYDSITGLEHIDKIINIDQKPIGRTPRSNPATYTKLFEPIRDLFAMLPEARTRGYDKGRFSFNVAGGRCEICKGDGQICVEMHFLPDVYVQCESCKGKRFNSATLEVKYKDRSIAEVLNLSVREAWDLFQHQPTIAKILATLLEVGLDYVQLGQAATTLSGGEAQRIKLARELAKKDTGKTLYILDEPTTGLHFADIRKLLSVLHTLVDRGNTVLVIEHNLDVIKTADWIIDIGPEGGEAGGKVIVAGTPRDIVKCKASVTGEYLKDLLP